MIHITMPTVTMTLEDYQKLVNQNQLMQQALNDKSITLASYHGYEYHIINPTHKLEELIKEMNLRNIKLTP